MTKKEFRVKGAAVAGHSGSAEARYNGPIGGVVIIGLPKGGKLDDPELVDHIRRHATSRPVLVLTGENSQRQIEAALDIGMDHFLRWPCQASSVMEKFADLRGVPEQVTSPGIVDHDGFVVSRSPAMIKIKDYLKKVALTDSNVLLTGETGTGKDVAAEFIHKNSLRKTNPLLCVNCTAFPETLLESELFGYEKGAFTSAMTARPGKFEMAAGGTLFLDEIGDMGLSAQAKILRAIEKKEIWRIGGGKPCMSDFRLITATNRDPEQLIGSGRFRDDLYYRLNIARVHLPPLRERKEDIEALAGHAIGRLNIRFNMEIRGLGEDVLDLFRRYDWPGNIRQLSNVIEAAFINAPVHVIRYEDLPESFKKLMGRKGGRNASEHEKILKTLSETGWNISRASEKLDVSRMTLYRKMAKYSIKKL